MTFWGELTDGTELLLGNPLEAELLYDSDAPADQLKAVFPTEKLWDDLAVVRVFHQGQVVFGGIVDEQNVGQRGLHRRHAQPLLGGPLGKVFQISGVFPVAGGQLPQIR